MSPRAGSLGALLAALSLGIAWSGPLRAEAPAFSASPGLPDVVVLNNGGMLRGAIVELVPDGAVTIALPTGETRTIPMAEVEYAGPTNAAPWNRKPAEAAPPAVESSPAPEGREAEGIKPLITLHADRARLSVVGKEPNLTVHLKSGTAAASVSGTPTNIQADSFTTICTAPCEASLPVGTHDLAVSDSKAKTVIAAEDPVQVTGPGTLMASYESRTGMRIAGWVVFGASMAGGVALMMTSIDGTDFNYTQFGIGTSVMTVGMIGGLALARVSDRASISFIPGVAATPMSPKPAAPAKEMQSASLLDTPGLTVVGRF